MKRIKLTQGQVALVDDADYDWLTQYKWCAYKHRSGNFYSIRASSRKDGKQYTIMMHRQILGLKKGDKRQGDHRDHNTLDNRRNNLRICTGQQNQLNQKSHPNTTSRFKGVSWSKSCKKWIVHIRIKGKLKHLGYFISEIEAALMYDKAAEKYYKEFAYLNFN